eukprot:4121657-Pyramimonas_sp.AAC.2
MADAHMTRRPPQAQATQHGVKAVPYRPPAQKGRGWRVNLQEKSSHANGPPRAYGASLHDNTYD